MEKDFRKNCLEYIEGFIDGLVWVLENRDEVGLYEIVSMAKDILKAFKICEGYGWEWIMSNNEEIINYEERYLNS